MCPLPSAVVIEFQGGNDMARTPTNAQRLVEQGEEQLAIERETNARGQRQEARDRRKESREIVLFWLVFVPAIAAGSHQLVQFAAPRLGGWTSGGAAEPEIDFNVLGERPTANDFDLLAPP